MIKLIKYLIAFAANFILIFFFISALDLLILLAYYKLSQKLSSHARQLVTQALRAESAGNLCDVEEIDDLT